MQSFISQLNDCITVSFALLSRKLIWAVNHSLLGFLSAEKHRKSLRLLEILGLYCVKDQASRYASSNIDHCRRMNTPGYHAKSLRMIDSHGFGMMSCDVLGIYEIRRSRVSTRFERISNIVVFCTEIGIEVPEDWIYRKHDVVSHELFFVTIVLIFCEWVPAEFEREREWKHFWRYSKKHIDFIKKMIEGFLVEVMFFTTLISF